MCVHIALTIISVDIYIKFVKYRNGNHSFPETMEIQDPREYSHEATYL